MPWCHRPSCNNLLDYWGMGVNDVICYITPVLKRVIKDIKSYRTSICTLCIFTTYNTQHEDNPGFKIVDK